MTDTAVRPDLSPAVERLATQDPAWLAEVRRAALARFEDEPLPSRVAHLWRYTDPARLLPGERGPARTVFDLGEKHPDGVTLTDLRSAARDHEDLVRERLWSLAEPSAERGGSTCHAEGAKFDSLSAALADGGFVARIGRGVRSESPLVVRSRVEGSGLTCARSLIAAEEGSEATVVLHVGSTDDAAALYHDALEIFLGKGAKLRLFLVQVLGRGVSHAPLVRARVERDAALETTVVVLGGGLVKSLQTTELAEPGASVEALGIVYGDRRQHFDHHTFQNHTAPHTKSDLDFRAVVSDRARSVYTGRLRIGPAGAGCDAHQSNRNLLLSDHARADTIPELEILTNDVTCSHAAASGPIDLEQVFFCTSRGLSPDEARRTIVKGFLEPTLARIPDADMLASIREALDGRLESVR